MKVRARRLNGNTKYHIPVTTPPASVCRSGTLVPVVSWMLPGLLEQYVEEQLVGRQKKEKERTTLFE
jgi:hypothetical protein